MYRAEENASLLYSEAARIVREAVRDKSYRAFPLGLEAGAYLRWKRGVITKSTYRDYESCLDKLAREFPDLELADFEPPVGTERLEEFLDLHWGSGAPRTYNKNRSVLRSFFEWAVLKGKLHGDPMLPIRPHKKRDVHREVFSTDIITRIIVDGPAPEPRERYRDEVALRLLLEFGIRKGALQTIQYKHFDHDRRVLTIFSKGEKVRPLQIRGVEFWISLEEAIKARDAQPDDFLMCRSKHIWRGYEPNGSSRFEVKLYPWQAMGGHGLHNWWYGCLERAGMVAEGQRSGEKMHKARHSAGQALLEEFHDIVLVQKLLGHTDPATTMKAYTGYDEFALAEYMEQMLERRRRA